MKKQVKNAIAQFETSKIQKSSLKQIKGGNGDGDDNLPIVIEEEIVN